MFELIAIGVTGLLIVAYYTFRRTPQVASEKSRSFSGSILGAPEDMSSEPCSRCRFSESTDNAREVWCHLKHTSMFWNASCERFEINAPAAGGTGGRIELETPEVPVTVGDRESA
jgi:hypothetical protein